VRGWRNQQDFVAKKRLGADVSCARRSFNESERNFLLPDRVHNVFGIAAQQRGMNAGIFRAKLAEQARQNVLRNGCGSAESEPARTVPAQGSDFLLRSRHQLTHAPRVLKQRGARSGQSRVRSGAIEELDAKIFLKSLDLKAYRGLRQIKFFGGFAKALLFRDSPKDNQAEILETCH
jgi:hypothetical protein